jgi:hypothetical protein
MNCRSYLPIVRRESHTLASALSARCVRRYVHAPATGQQPTFDMANVYAAGAGSPAEAFPTPTLNQFPILLRHLKAMFALGVRPFPLTCRGPRHRTLADTPTARADPKASPLLCPSRLSGRGRR